MLKRFLYLLLILLLPCSYALAEISLGDVTLAGSVKNEASIRTNNGNGDLTKLKNIIELAGQYNIKPEELVFFVKAKYFYDAAYDLRD
ncbi:MAG TPA: hypothetical protein VMD04_05625, partial [Candidatus Margulisiibacteriota bacterium]|nr:hypothetical protein [Candidatus Margulisiibacteriota bacterium]